MTDYDDTNRFVLFINDKGGNEKRPDYTGKLTLPGGQVMRMSAWIREGKSGTFMSGQIEPQQQTQQDRPQQAKQAEPASGGFDDFSDDIPF